MIPRRNRGRPGTVEKAAIKEKEIDNLVDDKVSSATFESCFVSLFQSDKEKFKLWKASMKISPEEVPFSRINCLLNICKDFFQHNFFGFFTSSSRLAFSRSGSRSRG